MQKITLSSYIKVIGARLSSHEQKHYLGLRGWHAFDLKSNLVFYQSFVVNVGQRGSKRFFLL